MINSMDTILVKYGVSLSQEDQAAIKHPWGKDKREKAEELKGKIKAVSLPEFLKISPEELSETEQNIQRAIKLVYDLNGKEPPLYKEFPTFRSKEHPLTIDITTAGNNYKSRDYAAAYKPQDNRVIFEEVNDRDLLILTLAHELKHAEQEDEETYEWDERSAFGSSMENAYAWHQLGFLREAQAYTQGARVYYEVFKKTGKRLETRLYDKISKKYTTPDGQTDAAKIEEEMIKAMLDELYHGKHKYSAYKDIYDESCPIKESDKGLTDIPESFHLPQSLMEKLKECPKKARSIQGKLLQAAKNENMEEYIRLIHEGISKNEKISPSLSFIMKAGSLEQIQDMLALQKQDKDYLFTNEDVQSQFNFCQDANILKYLLSVNRNDQNVIDTKTIVEKLSGGYDNKEEFNTFIQVIQKKDGTLPFVAQDFQTEYGSNQLLQGLDIYSPEGREKILQMLPVLLKLKGRDGQPLVKPEQWAEKLASWSHEMENPKDLYNLLDVIKDEKGCLPIEREAFDIRDPKYEFMNGQNHLLCGISSFKEERKKYFLTILPMLMELKDKNGKKIISQENIERFPKSNDLASAVKAYAKPKTSKLEILLAEKSHQGQKVSQTQATVIKRKIPQVGD